MALTGISQPTYLLTMIHIHQNQDPIGNGIYTFIDKGTQFNKIFDEDEVGSYKNINDLGAKIEYMLTNIDKINKFGKNGKIKYFKIFNSKIISKKIIDKTF